LNSDRAAFAFKNYMRFKWNTDSVGECIVLEGEADKKSILSGLRNYLKLHPKVLVLYIFYNGHGTVNNEVAWKAGYWHCGNNEDIVVEELMLICSEHAAGLDKPLFVNIVSDCCGSGGIYYRL
jgi:hypothetical protein